MIKQYQLLLTQTEGPKSAFEPCVAYALYGSLMQKLSADEAWRLHTPGEPLLTHHLTPVHGGAGALWTVNLLSKENSMETASVLEDCNEYTIISQRTSLRVNERKSIAVSTLNELLLIPGCDMECSRYHMRFVSPTSFHIDGGYQFFPTVRHILQSLVSRWNASFPSTPVHDNDAQAAMEHGTRITGYDLKSSYYRLKGNSIAAFTGHITLNARLSPPLLQLLRGLLAFGVFAGVGIKTSLGMGGVTVRESPKRE